jgi:hypothetical protein
MKHFGAEEATQRTLEGVLKRIKADADQGGTYIRLHETSRQLVNELRNLGFTLTLKTDTYGWLFKQKISYYQVTWGE